MLERTRSRSTGGHSDDRHRPAPMLEQRASSGAAVVMVIFGASGDLTRRKLDSGAAQPAARRPAARRVRRARRGPPAASRTTSSASGQRRARRLRRAERSGLPRLGSPALLLSRRRRRAAGHLRADQEATGGHGRRVQDRRQLSLLPRGGADAVRRRSCSGSARRGSRSRRTATGGASSSRSRSARTSTSARALNHEIAQVLDRVADLPDRSLPRQGDRPEHPGVSLRQRRVRADLEPALHRSRADHRRRRPSASSSAAATTTSRARCATWCPNHLFQLISLTAMEPPSSFDANAVRDEQTKVLRAIQPYTPEEVLRRTVRGQYGAGDVNGEARKAYRSEEPTSPPDSTYRDLRRAEAATSTTGAGPTCRSTSAPASALPKRETTITIQFKRPPFLLFRDTPVEQLDPNRLVLHIQPDEGIALSFGAKVARPAAAARQRRHVVRLRRLLRHGAEHRLRAAALRLHDGRRDAVPAADMVEAGWTVVEPILDVWKALPPATSRTTPLEAGDRKRPTELLARSGRQWFNGAVVGDTPLHPKTRD